MCEEAIPVRLLGAHLDLELHRVDEILKTAGSSVVVDEAGWVFLLSFSDG